LAQANTQPPADEGYWDKPLPQVTVEAKRATILPLVRAFIDQTVVLKNAEGVPRWNSPVCPSVVGLPRAEGGYVLERLSQVARAARIPLGSETCKPPNLYIVVTDNPRLVLTEWARKGHWEWFGGARPDLIGRFIDSPRPVRVWYNTRKMDSVDGHPGVDSEVGVAALGAQDTRIIKSVVWYFSSVMVVVDQTQLTGISRGQLGDYVSMVSLAELSTDRLGDVPTILKLFSAPRDQARLKMSPWDEAFLDALYNTNQASSQQLQQMTLRMVRDLVP
jgi:hypothetical protein